MMKIREYLELKYGRKTSIGLLACEAEALHIPYPLEKGWLSQYGEHEISEIQKESLLTALKKSKSKHAKKAISILSDGIVEESAKDKKERLSAMAAEILQMLIEVLDKMPLTDSGRFNTPTATKARALIAKALGEQS